MTKTFNILILSFAIVSYSCNNSDTKSKTQNISFDTVTSTKEVKPTVSSVKEIKIDSSKLLKAFADIYFGIPEAIEDKPDGGRYDVLAGKTYTIAGYDFFVGLTEYSDKGLYKFDLNSKKRFDTYNDLLKAIEEVHDLTLLSYKTFNTISITTNILQWYNDMWKLPADNGEEHYI